MRIFGGHDYYDGAGWGVDPTLVYTRTSDNHLKLRNVPRQVPYLSKFQAMRDDMTPFLAIVGERIFPGLEWRMWAGNDIGWVHETDFDPESCLERCDKVMGWRPGKPFKQQPYFYARDIRPELIQFFQRNHSPDWLEWQIDNRVATAIVKHHYFNAQQSGTHAIVNAPILKDWYVYRAIDAASAHMEISRFLSNLSYHPDTIEPSNRSRILKAGFDLKTSFRKGPG